MDEKLQKVLARAGIASRREAERWIASGRVSVNGKVATLGDRVVGDEKILVDGKPVKSVAARAVSRRVLVYNKPEGEVCSRNDPEGRPTVFDHLPAVQDQRWVCVGRLDINTSGLLLFTTDGELANKLMHPSTEIDREYAVRVRGSEVNDDVLERLKKGVELEDGVARFTDVRFFRGEGTNHWYHAVLMEGRNREVRRLWDSQGVTVSRLKRVRYGCIFLPSYVKVGQWVELETKDINELVDLVGMEPIRDTGPSLQAREKQKRKQSKLKVRQRSGKKPPRPRR